MTIHQDFHSIPNMLGIYDSGIGGLAILREILKIDESIPYVFYADTANLPLGNLNCHEIKQAVKNGCQYLFDQSCSVVVLACNTASVTSIRHIQQAWLPENYPDKQVLGISSPLIEKVISSTEPEQQGVILSTLATQQSGFYQVELKRRGYFNFKSIPCSGLASAIEEEDKEKVKKLLSEYCTQFKINPNQQSYVVLACTHYEWISAEIKSFFPNAQIISSSRYVARQTIDYIKRHPEYELSGGIRSIICSGKNTISDSKVRKYLE